MTTALRPAAEQDVSRRNGRGLRARTDVSMIRSVNRGGVAMKRTLSMLALGASALISAGAWAQADLSLWRIDCGTGAKPTPVNERFSDTFAFPGLNLTFTFSCYLIKH